MNGHTRESGGFWKGASETQRRILMDQGKCLHMLGGQVSYKLCTHAYNCLKCPYDRMLDDAGLLAPQGVAGSGFSAGRSDFAEAA